MSGWRTRIIKNPNTKHGPPAWCVGCRVRGKADCHSEGVGLGGLTLPVLLLWAKEGGTALVAILAGRVKSTSDKMKLEVKHYTYEYESVLFILDLVLR